LTIFKSCVKIIKSQKTATKIDKQIYKKLIDTTVAMW